MTKINYPYNLKEFADYQSNGEKEADKAKLREMLIRILGGIGKNEVHRVVLKDFSDKCQISIEEFNQLEKEVKELSGKPVILRFDNTFRRADVGKAESILRAELENNTDYDFSFSKVVFDCEGKITNETDRVLRARGKAAFSCRYRVPKERGDYDLKLIVQLQENEGKGCYAYDLGGNCIVQNFTISNEKRSVHKREINRDSAVNKYNSEERIDDNFDDIPNVSYESENINSVYVNQKSSQHHKEKKNYTEYDYIYSAELSKKLHDELNKSSVGKTSVKPEETQLTRTAELSVLSRSELSQNIYLYSQPLITLGRTTDITDIALPLKTGLPEKESSYFSIFHGVLWLDATGLHYLPCGKNLDTLNDKELEQAAEKRLWQVIADSDKIDFAGGRISCSVAIKKPHTLPQSVTAPTSPLIEGYLNLLAAYNAYRKADRFAKKEASFTQAPKAKAVAEEKYDHLGKVFADFQQAQANTPIDSSVDYVHLMYDEPQESVSHILLANTLTIGSGATAGLRTNNAELHAHHAELSHRDNAYCIKNIAGDGLVWVNQNSLKYNDSQWLSNNDHIYLGANRNQALRLQIRWQNTE